MSKLIGVYRLVYLERGERDAGLLGRYGKQSIQDDSGTMSMSTQNPVKGVSEGLDTGISLLAERSVVQPAARY